MYSKWKEFLIDVGDIIGGLFVGLGAGLNSKPSLIIGIILILLTFIIKYYKKCH